MNVIEWLQTNWELIISIAAIVVTAASAVAATTPTPKEGTTWSKIYKVIDWLALNIGKAKDKG